MNHLFNGWRKPNLLIIYEGSCSSLSNELGKNEIFVAFDTFSFVKWWKFCGSLVTCNFSTDVYWMKSVELAGRHSYRILVKELLICSFSSKESTESVSRREIENKNGIKPKSLILETCYLNFVLLSLYNCSRTKFKASIVNVLDFFYAKFLLDWFDFWSEFCAFDFFVLCDLKFYLITIQGSWKVLTQQKLPSYKSAARIFETRRSYLAVGPAPKLISNRSGHVKPNRQKE